MKVPLEWLKEYVAVRLAPEALAERLTMAGLEVTGLEQVNGEPVLDVEVTPNRADCFSIIGIAREVAAITGQRLKPPLRAGGTPAPAIARGGPGGQGTGEAKSRRSPFLVPRSPTIRIEDRKGCQRYIGRLIDGIRTAPSPEWMQRRLIACGVRPINNIVDVTNYVLLEYGQPLHAFDFARLANGAILVRRARAGESMIMLDGTTKKLTPDMLVVADANRPVAVAGVMGGMGSEVTAQTSRVLLESALFDSVVVRRTARSLGLATESSYRFERGVDPAGVEAASMRAASLICRLAGGEARVALDAGRKPSKRTTITLDTGRVNRWLGLALSPSTVRTALARLSCRVASSGASPLLRVEVPSFRRDLTQDVDLIEELARVVGYDRFPMTLPRQAVTAGPAEHSAAYWRSQSLRCLCASLGLTEAITWSLVSEVELARCGYSPDDAAKLSNPLSQDHAYLRPSLLIGLLQVVRRNATQGASSIRLFEVGSIIEPHAAAGERERLRLGVVLSGLWARDWRVREACDFFRLKGLLQALTERLCGQPAETVAAPNLWAEPRESTSVKLGERVVGAAGQVSRAMTHALDLEQEVWFAELFVDALVALKRPTPTVTPPPMFPPVKRDLSMMLDARTPFEAIARSIREVGGRLASRVELIDRYTGKQLPAGTYSLTFSIEYRDPSRTLTAAEADALHQRVGQTLVSQFGAKLR